MTKAKAPRRATTRVLVEERRKPTLPGWLIPTLSAIFSILTTVITVSMAVGGVQERLKAVELAQEKARSEQTAGREALSAERKELKQDVQTQVAALQQSINALDQKLTALLLARSTGTPSR